MKNQTAAEIQKDWTENPRWAGVTRPYTAEDVLRLRGPVHQEYTLATNAANKFWNLLQTETHVRSLGAFLGDQAVQQVKAGLKAIYLSGWQAAASQNSTGQVYPDQSLYPVDSVPKIVRNINASLLRAGQIAFAEGQTVDYMAPIIADLEAGFGGPLNAYELMKAVIEAGTGGAHLENQLSSQKRCGHQSSRVLIPTKSFIKQLVAARLAADVMGVSTVLIGRTDAESASFITSDCDERDVPFIDYKNRSDDGFFGLTGDSTERCVAQAVAYAPYCDIIWQETSKPDLKQAYAFAKGVHEKYPGKLLAYNLSPSFRWDANLSESEIGTFCEELAGMGFRYQFVTLAGYHAVNMSMYELARHFKSYGMTGYVNLQKKEFEWESYGYTAVKHQKESGVGYFDAIRQVIDGNDSMSALKGSTEDTQFKH